MHAELCLVCNGKGTTRSIPLKVGEHPCHGCGGTGWVTVSDWMPSQRKFKDGLMKTHWNKEA